MGDVKSCLITAVTASLPSLFLLTSTGSPEWSSMLDEVSFWGNLACGRLSGHTSTTIVYHNSVLTQQPVVTSFSGGALKIYEHLSFTSEEWLVVSAINPLQLVQMLTTTDANIRCAKTD